MILKLQRELARDKEDIQGESKPWGVGKRLRRVK